MKCVGAYEVIQSPLCTADVYEDCLIPTEINCEFDVQNTKTKIADHCDLEEEYCFFLFEGPDTLSGITNNRR